MIARSDLEFALSIQERSFKLLQWLSKAVREGFVPIVNAHDVAGAGDAARYWLQRQRGSLPVACRPADDEIEAFANFFGTYLETSFDLKKSPTKRLVSGCGCYCSFCLRLVESRNLILKTLTPQDKKRAAKLRLRRLEELALEAGAGFNEDRASSILEIESQRLDASRSAYASALIERLHGFSDGPSVLALWRDFAWNRSGAPIHDFKLRANDIVEAEIRLLSLLNA
ncbi:MAG: hypothetical protein KGR69_10715 [Verrucomicrobia bacterium]|nr:hypothetical protein [Verrucomicrobiota bacterium]